MSRATFKKIITDEETIKRINPENLKLMEKFLKEKNTRSSDLTIKNYKSDMLIFFCWNCDSNNNKLFTDIRKIEFSDFFSYAVEELKWGSARFSRMKSTLSSFSVFIEKYYDDVYPKFRNVILQTVESMPKSFAREKTILTEEQVLSALKHFSSADKQIACWLALAVASGSRFAELLRFETTHIDNGTPAFDGIFIETARPIKTKGRTKQGKLLHKYIIRDIFMPYYNEWIVERKQIIRNNFKDGEHDFIFINIKGDKATEAMARGWSNKIEEFLGVSFYPHCIRHYTTSYLVKTGLQYVLIKELFGWESIEMVSVYDDVSAKDKEWKELENLKTALSKSK